MKGLTKDKKRYLFLILALCLLFSFSNTNIVFATDSEQSVDEKETVITTYQGKECVAGEVLVRFSSNQSGAIMNMLESLNSTVQATLPDESVVVTSIPEGNSMEDFISELESISNVEYVQPNYFYRLHKTVNDPGAQIPDPGQWHLDTIDAYEAWDISMGSADVTVAVLDTGVDLDHPDLAGQIYMHTDTVDNDENANDDDGHGTHVSGIIAAATDNGLGVAGIAPDVKLIVADVFGWYTVETNPGVYEDVFGALTSEIIEGVEYATENGADVINMSLGGYYYDLAYETAIDDAVDAGTVVVASAGNDGKDEYDETEGVSTKCYPADFDSCISVIWTNEDDTRNPNSNYGPSKDIAAPGNAILSTYWKNDDPDWEYALLSGTSMAAPVVTGVVALMLSVNPDLTVDEVKNILYGTATELGDPGRDDEYGHGRVNAQAAVQAAHDAIVVNVTGVTLSKTEIDVMVGDTDWLIAKVEPEDATNKAVTWSSSNEGIVTVSDGIITAVAEGYATITAETADGGYLATCHVTVIPHQEFNAFTNLGFTPKDMALDPDRDVAYLTEQNGYHLYRVDLNTGDIRSMVFPYKAERLTVKNGRVYLTLLHHPHTYWISHENSNGDGSFGVVDTGSFTLINMFEIIHDPYDIEADSAGRVYLGPGSGQWSIMTVYDSNTGERLSSCGGVRYVSLWDFNEQYNKLYSITQDSSPRDIDAYEITDGIITANYDTPYHGDYSMSKDICISPDGQHIFNGTGNVFTSAPTQDGDMIYEGNIGSVFTSICFDLDNNVFYTANESELKAFEYDARVEKYSINSEDTFVSIHFDGNNIAALLEKNTGEFYLDEITLQDNNADLSSLNVSTGTLESPFNVGITDYRLILNEDEESVTISCTAVDIAAQTYIDGEPAETKTVSVAKGEVKTVEIEVISKSGQAVRKYTLDVYRNIGDNTFTFNYSFFIPFHRFYSPDDNAIYMTATDQPYLYKVNENGELSVLRLPSTAKYIGASDTLLYVTTFDSVFNIHRICLVDMTTFTVVDSFNIDMIPYDVTGNEEYIYVSNSSQIRVYSSATLEELSENAIPVREMTINRSNGLLYVVNDNWVKSYQINDNKLTLQQSYASNSLNATDIEIMPDGRHTIVDNNFILTCSDVTEDDLQFIGTLSEHKRLGQLDSNISSNEIYGFHERTIQVYDASDFSLKRVMTEPDYIEDVMCAGDYLFVSLDEGQDTVLHSVKPSALLKTLRIDGDVFSEFYPTHFEIDRGDVPFAMSSVYIEAEAALGSATVSGDIGLQLLDIGENRLEITVTDAASGCSETYKLIFNRQTSDPPINIYNAFDDFGFEPFDMAIDMDTNTAYITEKDSCSLYKIDLATGEILSKTFDIKAERLTIKNGKVYLTLPRHLHSYYLPDGEGYGAIAVIDIATFSVEYIFDVALDPYDIEADDMGRVYIGPGSAQWSILSVYDSATGEWLSEHRSVRYKSLWDYNEQYDKLYSITQSSSPRDIDAYEIGEGTITAKYDSPYHGDYTMHTYMRISPDGHYIFNGSGNIFNCAPTQSGDMVYSGTLGRTFTSICFDLASDTFFTSEGKVLTVYYYSTREVRYQHTSMDEYIDIHFDDGKLIALQKKSNDEYFVRVEEIIPVTGIQLDQETMDLLVGENGTLTEQVTPVNATNRVVEWASSDETVAIVVDGVVSAINGGTAIITATTVDGGFSDTCEVTVTQKVEGVTLNKEETSLTIGGSETLVATIVPENATNQNITWASSNESVATVVDGVVTALSLGNTVVTVTTEDGNYTDTCVVKVAVLVTGVSLDESSLDLVVGESTILLSTISPSDATNQNIAWTSSNESVALVDGYGNVSVIATGTATITVTTEDGGYTAQCMVNVTQPVTGVSLNSSSLDVNVGSIAELIPTVEPANASNKSVIWSSSNEGIATVVNGTVTAHNIGEAIITVTTNDGGYTATCTVNVVQKVTGVELDLTELVLAEGENDTLSISVLPSDAANKIVTWTSSNTNVATVTNGTVSAVSEGTSVITVRTVDGGYTDSCAVTVKSAQIESSVYSVDRQTGYLKGVDIATSVSTLKSNLANDAVDIKVYDSAGNEYTGALLRTGMTVRLVINSTVHDELKIVILGDASGDGYISITDYTLARLDILGLKALAGEFKEASDVNGDGVISITDYTLIRLDILGLKKIH